MAPVRIDPLGTPSATHGRFRVHGLGADAPAARALRVSLLRLFEGVAVTALRIETVDGVAEHDFSVLTGLEESVPDFVLAAKRLRFRLPRDRSHAVTQLSAEGPRTLTSADLPANTPLERLGAPELLCTLQAGATLRLELLCERGRGELLSQGRGPSPLLPGSLPIDALFSPVLIADVFVEDGGWLRAEIETDGSLGPEEAIARAVATATSCT